MISRAVVPNVSQLGSPLIGRTLDDITILCGNLEGGLRDTVSKKVKVEPLEPAVGRGIFSRLRLTRAMGKYLDSDSA